MEYHSFRITEDTTLYAEWTRTANLVTRTGDTASPASVVFYYDADGKACYDKSTTEQGVDKPIPVTLTPATGWTKVGWATTATATADDRDEQIVELSDAHALLLSTGGAFRILFREL